MSFPRYAQYRPSEIPWIEKLPLHWKSQRLKTIFQLMGRPVREEDEIVTAFRDGEVTLRANRREEGYTNALQEIGYQGVRKNDLVIHAMDAFAGAVGVSDSDGKSTPVYSVCQPHNDQTISSYYGSLLRYMALSGFINSLAKGIRERSTDFRWSDAGNVLVPVPTKSEQESIVSFIDRETSKIDALIEEQRRVIELLKEKRQAVISHAVTKGLNPDTPMTESGVDWIGSVPTHWKVTRLSHFATIENGTTPSRDIADYWSGGQIPWLASGEVNQGRVLEATEFITEKALLECSLRLLPTGTIIVGMVGQGRTRGMSAILCLRATINQNLAAVCPGPQILSEFVWYLFHAMYISLREDGRGGNQAAINCQMLAALRVPVPPIHEQTAVVRFLNSATEQMDMLETEANGAIDLLQERRSALISAAVTGKIDLRNYTPKEAKLYEFA
jgi:type I restriction enzyme, S subunit